MGHGGHHVTPSYTAGATRLRHEQPTWPSVKCCGGRSPSARASSLVELRAQGRARLSAAPRTGGSQAARGRQVLLSNLP